MRRAGRGLRHRISKPERSSTKRVGVEIGHSEEPGLGAMARHRAGAWQSVGSGRRLDLVPEVGALQVGSSTASSQTSLSSPWRCRSATTVLPNPVRSDSAPLIFFWRRKLTHFAAAALSLTPLVIAQLSSQESAPSLGLI